MEVIVFVYDLEILLVQNIPESILLYYACALVYPPNPTLTANTPIFVCFPRKRRLKEHPEQGYYPLPRRPRFHSICLDSNPLHPNPKILNPNPEPYTPNPKPPKQGYSFNAVASACEKGDRPSRTARGFAQLRVERVSGPRVLRLNHVVGFHGFKV